MSGHSDTELKDIFIMDYNHPMWDEYTSQPVEKVTAKIIPNRDAPNRCYPHIYVEIFMWVKNKQFRYSEIIYKGQSEVNEVLRLGADYFINLPSNKELIGKTLKDVIGSY